MKLFVWVDPYGVTYGSSMVFAVAETVERAKEILQASAIRYTFGRFKQGVGMVGFELGEPTRILDLPCGEWHEWSE